MKFVTYREIMIDLLGRWGSIGIVMPDINTIAYQIHYPDNKFRYRMYVDHTYLLYFVPFIDRIRAGYISSLLDEETIPIRNKTRWLFGGISYPNIWMRYCPVCVREDRKSVGESYWHRIHQIQGVEVCPRHGLSLIDSNLLVKDCSLKLITAESAINNSSALYIDEADEKLIKIAEDIEWILEQREKIFSFNLTKENIWQLFTASCIGEQFGVDYRKRIRGVILGHYSRTNLTRLRCDIYESNYEQWPERLLSPRNQRATNPLHVILFIQAFGYRIKDLPVLLQ